MTLSQAMKIVQTLRALDNDFTRSLLRSAVERWRERSTAGFRAPGHDEGLLGRFGLERRRSSGGSDLLGVLGGFGAGVVLGAGAVVLASPQARRELQRLVDDLAPWVEQLGERYFGTASA